MRHNVLCVDEAGIVKIEMSGMLKSFDIGFTDARDFKDAAGILKDAKTKFSAVIWALNYADLKDFDLIRKMKGQDSARNIPVIIVSKFTDKRYIIKAIESGASEYIVKPYDEQMTVRKLCRILGIPFEKPAGGYEEEEYVSFDFSELVNKELKSASRGSYPLSIVMAAIMPQEYDTYSQSRMNEIIKLINRVIRTKLRETDTSLCYGTNNLVLILPFSDKNGAATVERKIHEIYDTHTVIKQSNRNLKLVTAGVSFPEDGKIREKLLEKLENQIETAVKRENK